MTESNELRDAVDGDSSPGSESTSPGTKAATKAQRPKKRFRKTRRLLGFVIVLALVLRVSLPLWLPQLIDRFAKDAGLVVRYDDLNLSLLGASVELWGLEIDLLEPVEGEGARILDLDYFAADVDSSALLMGEPILHRAEVGNLAVFLRRRADGTWQLAEAFASDPGNLDQVASVEPEAPGPGPKSTADPEPAPFDLNLPLAIERLTVTSLAVNLDDRLRKEVRRLDFELGLSGIGNADGESAPLFMEASIPGFLTALRVEGLIHQNAGDLAEGESSLGLDLSVKVLGMDPKALDPWGEELGIAGLAHDVEARFGISVLAETSAGASELGVSFALDEARWEADGDLKLGLEGATGELMMAHGQGAEGQAVQLRKMEFFGLRAEAERLENGKFGALGFGQVAKAAQPEEPAAEEIDEPTETSSSAMLIAGLSTRDFGLRFVDRLEGTSIQVKLDSLDVGAMQIGGAVQTPTELEARLSVPGIFDEAVLAGSVMVGNSSAATLEFDLANLRLDKLEPYLTQAGIESEIKSGQFHGRLEASTAANGALRVSLKNVLLTDSMPAPKEVAAAATTESEIEQDLVPDKDSSPGPLSERLTLFAVNRLDVLDLLAEDTGGLRIGQVSIRGTTLDAVRLADGSLRAAGLHLLNQPTGSPVAVAAPKASDSVDPSKQAIAPVSAAPLEPVFRVDLFTLSETHVSFDDQAGLTPELWAPSRVDLRLSNLVLGDPTRKHRAELRLDLEMPGLIGALMVDLDVDLEGGGVDGAMDLRASGIGLDRLAPYLAPLGIEGEVDRGKLAGKAKVRIDQDADGMLVAASLTDWSYLNDDGAELLGLDKLNLESLRLPTASDQAIELGPLLVDGLRMGAERNAKGELRLLGLHLIDKPVAKPTGPSGIPVASQTAKPTADTAPMRTVTSAGVRAQNMQIAWRDQAVAPKVDTKLVANLDVSPFTVGSGGEARKLTATFEASVRGLVEQLALTFDATLNERAPRAAGEFKLGGMNGAALSAYLPKTIEATFADARQIHIAVA